MTIRTTRRSLLGAALAAPALLSGTARAQTNWPSQAITLVIPFAPGGPTDAVGRMLAEAMSRDLGVNVVAQNVGGAGGTIGVNRVAQARPDGYTVLLHNIGMATAPTLYRRLPYNPLTAFEMLGLVTATPMVWLTRPDFPATSASTSAMPASAPPASCAARCSRPASARASRRCPSPVRARSIRS